MPMLRRKLGTLVQVNLRVREELRRALEAAASAHNVSFNQELTARLEASLEQEARQSLQSLATNLERRSHDIELATRRLEDLAKTVMERTSHAPSS